MAIKVMRLLISFLILVTLSSARDSAGRVGGVGDNGLAESQGRWRRADALLLNEQQTAVLSALRHAWQGYRDFAWGFDDLQPLSKSGHNWLGLGATLVDALDLLFLVGDDEEFARARDWVRDEMNTSPSAGVNFFETTIRVLGGLLSAHYLTGGEGANAIFLVRALALGEGLSVAFRSPSGLPFSDVRLAKGEGFSVGDTSLSEASTVQLEFKSLARTTGNSSFTRLAEEAMNAVFSARDQITGTKRKVAQSGLVPIFLDPVAGTAKRASQISLGARGDSYYEYLLKQWLLAGKAGGAERYLSEYRNAIDGIFEHLAYRLGNWTIVGELTGNDATPKFKMDHLVCFLPGTLALGVLHGADPFPADHPNSHLALARDLLATCLHGYDSTSTGLAAEIWHFEGNSTRYAEHPEEHSQSCTLSGGEESRQTEAPDSMRMHTRDSFSLLRPETAESLFYLWRVTREESYREAGWRIFNSMERHARVPTGGYASLDNINSKFPKQRNHMESFFMAETLKYFFLLFDDQDLLPLDEVVFNTEGHPFPIFATGADY